jgi:hypothetical protein
MISVDHNDEMKMKMYDAMLAIRIDDDANMLANSRDSAAEVVLVPHSLSFYTMFYKMTMEDRDEERREKKEQGKKRDVSVLEGEGMGTCTSAFFSIVKEYTKQ